MPSPKIALPLIDALASYRVPGGAIRGGVACSRSRSADNAVQLACRAASAPLAWTGLVARVDRGRAFTRQIAGGMVPQSYVRLRHLSHSASILYRANLTD